MILEVSPDTGAEDTVSTGTGFEGAVMITLGGCCGRTVTNVATVSVKPLASVAVARTVGARLGVGLRYGREC